MIWGISIQPGQGYTLTCEEELCVSLATIESRSKFDHTSRYTHLFFKKGSSSEEQLLCTLVYGTIFQQCLKLKLMPGEEITFRVEGPCYVNLTGYSYSSPPKPDDNGNAGGNPRCSDNVDSENDDNETTQGDTHNDDGAKDSDEEEVKPEHNMVVNRHNEGNIYSDILALVDNTQPDDCNVTSADQAKVEWVPESSLFFSDDDQDEDGNTIFQNLWGWANDDEEQQDNCSPELNPNKEQDSVLCEQDDQHPTTDGCHIPESVKNETKIHQDSENASFEREHGNIPGLEKKSNLKCKYCEMNFCEERSLVEHEKNHITRQLFQCQYCKRRFGSRANLAVHNRTHRPAYKCEICEKECKQKRSLKSHQRTHFRENAYLCMFCGKLFGKMVGLVKHERSHHVKDGSTCKNYERNFQVKSELATHTQIHSGKKFLMCQYCGKNFQGRARFIIHERSHTGEKPFKCAHCEKSFSQKSNRKQHERKIHTSEKQFNHKSHSARPPTSKLLAIHDRRE